MLLWYLSRVLQRPLAKDVSKKHATFITVFWAPARIGFISKGDKL